VARLQVLFDITIFQVNAGQIFLLPAMPVLLHSQIQEMEAPMASTEGAGNERIEWQGSDEKKTALRILE